MAKKSPVHTVPHEDGWANRREGSERVSGTFRTQADAAAAGRQTAINDRTEHLIHSKDGTIDRRNTYAPKDPYPPKG